MVIRSPKKPTHSAQTHSLMPTSPDKSTQKAQLFNPFAPNPLPSPQPITSKPNLSPQPNISSAHSPTRHTIHKNCPIKDLVSFFVDLESPDPYPSNSKLKSIKSKKLQSKKNKPCRPKKNGKNRPTIYTISNSLSPTLSDGNILSYNDNLLNKRFGEEIGILGKGNNGEIIAKLIEMEQRDKEGKTSIS